MKSIHKDPMLRMPPITNPILFEEDPWRLYGHIDDEYSTLGHLCSEWKSVDGTVTWRWFWGWECCHNCGEQVPENIQGLYLIHNFDRLGEE